jgi:hypothetical protein
MPPEYLAVVTKTAGELTNLAAVMRNALHLALGLSPLLALHPKKLDSQGIRRDYLIAVRQFSNSARQKVDFTITRLACSIIGQHQACQVA